MKFKLSFASKFEGYSNTPKEVEVNTIEELEELAKKYESTTYGDFGASIIVNFTGRSITIYDDYLY